MNSNMSDESLPKSFYTVSLLGEQSTDIMFVSLLEYTDFIYIHYAALL